jgi:predicted house-cleaning noncanonical NTP pyrophosphatase (MazG superfamily)
VEKIIEEASELKPQPSKEEIADVLEATYSLIKFEGFSLDEIEKIRKKKAEERGSFDKKIIWLDG